MLGSYIHNFLTPTTLSRNVTVYAVSLLFSRISRKENVIYIAAGFQPLVMSTATIQTVGNWNGQQ